MLVLADAVRSGYAFGHAGDPAPTPFNVGAASPRPFTITFPSAPWSNLANVDTLTMAGGLERSLDGGVTWLGFGAFSDAHNVPGKGGVIHPCSMLVSWDGQAMLVRGSVTVGPAPFAFAIDIT